MSDMTYEERKALMRVVGDQIADMTDKQRTDVLYWLSGYDPVVVAKAIEANR